jgi:hypothetical protein
MTEERDEFVVDWISRSNRFRELCRTRPRGFALGFALGSYRASMHCLESKMPETPHAFNSMTWKEYDEQMAQWLSPRLDAATDDIERVMLMHRSATADGVREGFVYGWNHYMEHGY